VLLGVFEGITGISAEDPEDELRIANEDVPPAEGLLRVSIPSLDPGPTGHRRSPWARQVIKCPTDALSGHDIAGRHTMPGALVDLPPGALVIVAVYRDPLVQGVPTVEAFRLESTGAWTRLGGYKGTRWAEALRLKLASWLPITAARKSRDASSEPSVPN
jgi:hypothetical protein